MNLRAVKLPPIKAIERMRELHTELKACHTSLDYKKIVSNLRASLYVAADYASELVRLGYHKDNVLADLLNALINAIVAPYSDNNLSAFKTEFNKYQGIACHFHSGDEKVFGFAYQVEVILLALQRLCKISKTNAAYESLLGKKPLVTATEAAALRKVKQMAKSPKALDAVEEKKEEQKEVDKPSSQSRPV